MALWIVNNKTFYLFIIKLMQYKDTSQQAFLIIYLICTLSFIYFSLGRSRWVSHLKSRSAHKKCGHPWLRLMAKVNRLFKILNIFKTGAFTFCLKLFRHRLVCLTSLFLSVSSLHVINEIWKFLNFCWKKESAQNCICNFIRLVKSLEFIESKMSTTFCCQNRKKCQRKKSYTKNVILIFIHLVRIQLV